MNREKNVSAWVEAVMAEVDRKADIRSLEGDDDLVPFDTRPYRQAAEEVHSCEEWE